MPGLADTQTATARAGDVVSAAGVPPGVASLLREDGSVVVPASVAREVLRALVRDLTARVRADGGEVSPDVRRVLWALHEAAQRADEPGRVSSADAGSSRVRTDAAGYVTVAVAARRLECSPRWIQRLARGGRIEAVRAGPVWLVSETALERHRKGRRHDDVRGSDRRAVCAAAAGG
jgi:excisionase family DNA binding protein